MDEINYWNELPDIDLPADLASQAPNPTTGLKRKGTLILEPVSRKRARLCSEDTLVDDDSTQSQTKFKPAPIRKTDPSQSTGQKCHKLVDHEETNLWNQVDDLTDFVSQIPPQIQASLKKQGSLSYCSPRDKRIQLDADNPVIIANSHAVQALIKDCPTGVQLELARLVSIGRLTYQQILACDALGELAGSNAEVANKTASTVLQASPLQVTADAQEILATSPWAELDTEQAILRTNPFGGIGNNDAHPGYFGGKVQFRATVRRLDKKDPKSMKIELDHTQLSTSSRFTRRFGSTAFIRVKVPGDLRYDSNSDLIDFFRRPVVVWNNVFRAFFAKDSMVVYFRTNEVFDLADVSTIDPQPTMSLWDFIVWANPPEFNKEQKLCKWASRFQLGLSDSVPGPMIKQENITEINDIKSEKGSDMTDGCGLGNLHLHLGFRRDFHLPSVPTAVQFRLLGGKGMLCLDSEDFESQTEKVSLRGSQIKIRFPPGIPLDPAHLTMDLLRFPRIRTPANLSHELIINLHHNGVPDKVFIKALHAHVEEVVSPLLKWEGKDAMYNLWVSLEQSEHVLSARRSREAAAESRINGGADIDDDDDDDVDDNFDLALGQRSTAWWPDPVSGCPSSLAETAMSLLVSGFHPLSCPILREKIHQLSKSQVRVASTRAHFRVHQSLSAFAIPDPYGVLGPNEIQIRSSKANLLRSDGMETNVILGDVLLTRNPCKVPTDVRKVKAVEHHKLRDLVDVVVCSVQGYRRLLDYLGGGDYDGDRVLAIWDPTFVQPFKNADEKFADEPEDLDKSFTVNKETVGDFCRETQDESEVTKIRRLHPVLLGALRDPRLLGNYSNYHSNVIYKHGYGHPLAIRIAYKFAKVMDAAKTGYELLPAVREVDKKVYGHVKGPKWLQDLKDAKGRRTKQEMDTSNEHHLRRKCPGTFIMDTISEAAKKVCDDWLRTVEAECRKSNTSETEARAQVDTDLIQPYLSLKQRAKVTGNAALLEDLGIIRKHVWSADQAYRAIMKGDGQQFTRQKIEVRQDALRQLSVQFHAHPRLEDLRAIHDQVSLARIRASLAYHDDTSRSISDPNACSRFPFTVAFRDLCDIKCEALGNHKTSTNDFYQRYKVTLGRH